MLRIRIVSVIVVLSVILTDGFHSGSTRAGTPSLLSAAGITRASSRARPAGKPTAIQPRPSSKSEASIVRNFNLKGKANRAIVNFELTEPGQIKVQANWKGTARRLALILNGPGQTQAYGRQDGASPLSLSYQVTEKTLAKGEGWRVSVVNFRSTGNATGTIRITYPKETKPTVTPKPAERPKPELSPQQKITVVKTRLENRIQKLTPENQLDKIVVPLFMQRLEEKSQARLTLRGINVSPHLQTIVRGYKQISPSVKRSSFHPRYTQLKPYQKVSEPQLGKDVLKALRSNYESDIRRMVRKGFRADRPKFHWDSARVRAVVRPVRTPAQAKLSKSRTKQLDTLFTKLRTSPSPTNRRHVRDFLQAHNFRVEKAPLSPLHNALIAQAGLAAGTIPDLNNDHSVRDYYRYDVVLDWFDCDQENEYVADEPYWHISATIPRYDPKDTDNVHLIQEGNLYRIVSRVTGDYGDVDAGETRIFRPQDRYVLHNNLFNTSTTFTIGLWEHDWSKGEVRDAIDEALEDLRNELIDQIRSAVMDALKDSFYAALEEVLPDELDAAVKLFFDGELDFAGLMTTVEDVLGGIDVSWLVFQLIFSGESITEIVQGMGGACPELTIALMAIKVLGPVAIDLFEGDFGEAFAGLVSLPVECIMYVVNLVTDLVRTVEIILAIVDPDDLIGQKSITIEGAHDDVFQDADWWLRPRGHVWFPVDKAQAFRDEHGYGPTAENCSLIKNNFYWVPALKFEGDDARYYAYYLVKRTLAGGSETFGYTIEDGPGSFMETRTYTAKSPRPGGKIRVSICALNTEQVPFVWLSRISKGGERGSVSNNNLNGGREFYVDSYPGYDYELGISWFGDGAMYGYVTLEE